MSGNAIRITGGISIRVTAMRNDNYDVSGTFGKYAFFATVYDYTKSFGIMGTRIVSLEMFRAKKLPFKDIKICLILRCKHGNWFIRSSNKKSYNTACTLVYNLNQYLPKFNQRKYK